MSVPPTPFSAVISGTGSYLPARVMTNEDMSRIVETSDEWITSRTGIRARRIAAPTEATSDMGLEAARRALADAAVPATDVDLILVATCTPDMIFPNTASIIQVGLGATRAACMDLAAACSGFVYGLEVAARLIQTGAYRHVLVIGSEKMSQLVDWKDRGTCVLFGDAAGAALVSRAPAGAGGYIDGVMGSDGSLGDLLKVPAGGSRLPTSPETIAAGDNFLKMGGREVFKHAVNNMSRIIDELLTRNGVQPGQIDLVIPHQANQRIIAAIQEKLALPAEKVFLNLDKYGNTSAASVGVAMDEAARAGLLKPGSLVVTVAFGAGFTWGASLIRWTK
jgi:3-oxoacyl-[acyl-carrier-protein] synthase III